MVFGLERFFLIAVFYTSWYYNVSNTSICPIAYSTNPVAHLCAQSRPDGKLTVMSSGVREHRVASTVSHVTRVSSSVVRSSTRRLDGGQARVEEVGVASVASKLSSMSKDEREKKVTAGRLKDGSNWSKAENRAAMM